MVSDNKDDEQVVQEHDFVVEPAGDPAQLLNDLEELESTLESDDEEMIKYDEPGTRKHHSGRGGNNQEIQLDTNEVKLDG